MMQILGSVVVLSIMLGLSMRCDASPTSCRDRTEEWFTSWNEFRNSSLLTLKACDSFKGLCAKSLQVICESSWRLNVSSHSVNGWREAPISSEDDMYSYSLDIGTGSFRSTIDEGKFTIEHAYRYGCEESPEGRVDPSTVCESNSTVWQSTRIITVLIPEVRLEISSGSEITGGETVRLSCSTNLPLSHKILMRFQHNSQVAYCHEFQENTEQYNEWKIYRVNGDDKHCVLEVENVTFASSGEYGCTGFLPDGTHLLSSVDIDVQGSPASIVTAGDFQTHVFGLWVTVSLLSLLMLTLVVIGIVFFVFFVFFKRKLKKKGFSNVDAQIEHNSHHVSPDDNRVSATAGDVTRDLDDVDTKDRAISRASDSDHILLKSIRPDGHRLNSDPNRVWSGRSSGKGKGPESDARADNHDPKVKDTAAGDHVTV